MAKKPRRYYWLKDYDSIALQQACIHLNRAFQNFFAPKLPARYPRFKRKHAKQSSYHCTSIVHERLANARVDFQHKLSRQFIDDNQAVVVETLKVKTC